MTEHRDSAETAHVHEWTVTQVCLDPVGHYECLTCPCGESRDV